MLHEPTPVESWRFYEEMARRGEYGEGEIVSAGGEVVLSPQLKIEADFFVAQLRGRSSVVDIGCGLGHPALTLAPHVARLVALDAAPTMLSRLRSHVKRLRYDNMGIVRARAEALPFESERFDGASICGTLGSVAQPERLLSELRRVMQPNGIVACVAENFADKLIVDQGKEFRRFRMDDGRLCLQVVGYLENPYRIRDDRYFIREDSDLYRALAAEHKGSLSWRAETQQKPGDLPRETVTSILYRDEAIEFDPATLQAAFESAGFRARTIELRRYFPVEHILATFGRR